MAVFIEGNTQTFTRLNGGHRTELGVEPEFLNNLSAEGAEMYKTANANLDVFRDMYAEAMETLKSLEEEGIWLDDKSVYDVDTIEKFGKPNHYMAHYVAGHPHYREMNEVYGFSYPQIEKQSDDMLDILYNDANHGIIQADADGYESFTLTSDDARDVGFVKLKWKDRLKIASTYDFMNICEEYGVDLFANQFEEEPYE